jgi:hypothetical protein
VVETDFKVLAKRFVWSGGERALVCDELECFKERGRNWSAVGGTSFGFREVLLYEGREGRETRVKRLVIVGSKLSSGSL